MIFYWTWQIGCPVSMDTRQSLSSSANQAERSAQDLPSKKSHKHFDLFAWCLQTFSCPAVLSKHPEPLWGGRCYGGLISAHRQLLKQANTISSASIQSSWNGPFHRQKAPHHTTGNALLHAHIFKVSPVMFWNQNDVSLSCLRPLYKNYYKMTAPALFFQTTNCGKKKTLMVPLI